MYVKEKAVKNKVRKLGLRAGKGVGAALDMAIDVILERAVEYVRPAKTMRREDILAYLATHNIKT